MSEGVSGNPDTPSDIFNPIRLLGLIGFFRKADATCRLRE